MRPVHVSTERSARTDAGILLEVGTYWKGDGYNARKLVAFGRRADGRLSCQMLSKQPYRRRQNGKPAMQRTWVLAGPAGPGRATPLDKATGRLALEA